MLSAVQALLNLEEIQCLKQSRILETEPWGNLNQPFFLNQILLFDYNGTPQNLLNTIRKIETENGRMRGKDRNMPRTLDIDILFFGNLILQTAELEIPHPRLHLRKFILEPLKELSPQLVHPLLKLTPDEMLLRLPPELH